MKPSMTSLRDLLRQNPNYRYTWMAQVVSEIGDYFNNIAVFALVMEKSGSGLVVTGVMLARAIPAVVAGPVAGVLLDRLDRRRIMIASDIVRAVIALAFVFTIHPAPVAALRAQRRSDVRIVAHRGARVHPATHRQWNRLRHSLDADHAVGARRRARAGGYSAGILGTTGRFVNPLLHILGGLSGRSVPGAFARHAARSPPVAEYRDGLSYLKSVPLMMGIG
jgi:MFS family permease